MSKVLKPGKKAVELQRPVARPSRIRREPVRQEPERLFRNRWWQTREGEITLATGGILFFALAISALVIDVGHVLGL